MENMVLLDNLIKLIKDKGISEKMFLSDMGLNRTILSDWKSGKSHSYMKYVKKIADYFNVSVDYLLGNTEQKEKPTTDKGNELKSEFAAMLEKLTPDELEQVRKYTRFLLEQQKSERNQ
ncbi:MAG: hypothetical protein A2Y15_08610 [Clostridiales bacterium GWF2_36_10]|nr:MAG: hypothetical protein A2Y15_08610 [Clostridiales bacterium GWF2_36_10]HAN20405.1 hypothetical protein [Clostridiales bacterium]